MKACVLESIGNLIYKEVPAPTPGAGEVLVAVKACGICSSDIPRVFKTGTYHFPTIPGHEFSGEVVDVGEGVSPSWRGKRVVVFPLLPCFRCDSCREQEYARCENYNYFGSRCDGGFSEYIAVPLWNVKEIDDALAFPVAALCEPTAVAIHSLGRIPAIADKRVLVIGSGTIGILAAMAAQSGGARVTLAGRNEKKLQYIKRFSIENACTVSEVTELPAFDVVLECVGSKDSVSQAVVMAKRGGSIVFTGNPASDILLEKNIYWKILRNELTIYGTWNSSYSETVNDWVTALAFLKENQDSVSGLITHTFPLSESTQAFETLRDPETMTIKVMLIPGEDA